MQQSMFDEWMPDDADSPPDSDPFDGAEAFIDPLALRQFTPLEGGLGVFAMRPYQVTALNCVLADFQQVNTALVVMPTGTGKTVLFSEACLRMPEHLGRALVIAHREELIDQAAEKIGLHIDREVGIEMGARRVSHGGKNCRVVVASIQTLARESRRAKFNPLDFGFMVIDEAHHAVSATYRTVVKHFLTKNPQMRILLVTATPKRADNKSLGDVAQRVSYSMDILQAINEGWLVDIKQKLIHIDGMDFSKVRKTRAGDLNEKDLAKVMLGGVDHEIAATGELSEEDRAAIEDQERMLHAVAKPTIDLSAGKPTLVFCVDKSHCKAMTDVLNRYPGVRAEWVTDDTPKDDRKRIITEFRAGTLPILCSVGVLTEGFDARVDFIAMARPTGSEALARQMVGRGTRPLPGLVDQFETAEERRSAIAISDKPCCTILDFVGITGTHKLVTITDILGGDYEEDVVAAAKQAILNGESELAIIPLLKKTKEELDERKKQLAMEQEAREQRKRELAEKERLEREAENRRRQSIIAARVQFSTQDVPLVKVSFPDRIGQDCKRGGATDDQVKALLQLGVKHETACGYSKAQAGAVISSLRAKSGGDWIIPFGKHMGNPIKNLDKSYLSWLRVNVPHVGFVKNYDLMMQQKNG